MDSKNFCASPWYEVRIDVDGKVRYCHASHHRFNKPTNFIQWFNQDIELTEHRNQIVDGADLPSCELCRHQEQLGLPSSRQKRNLQAAIHDSWFDESVAQSPIQTRLGSTGTIKPAFLHVSLSNVCNLACRMCNAFNSSKIADQRKKLNMIPVDTVTLLDWTTDDSLWQSFLELVQDNSQLLSVHFMGGEPLVHRRFFEFVDWCIDNQYTDFDLNFVTNCTVYNQDLVDKLLKFRSVQIEVSVENFADSNDYIRIGSNYNQVKINIEKYLGLRSKNVSVVLRPVPQALSIGDYHTLIDFAIQHQIIIDNNNLTHPNFLRVVVLPKTYRNELATKFKQRYAEWVTSDYQFINLRDQAKFADNLKQHINYLLMLLDEQEPANILELRQQFVKFNQTLDQQDLFLQVYPELANFYHEHS